MKLAEEKTIPNMAQAVEACIGLNRNDTRATVLRICGENFPYDEYCEIVNEMIRESIQKNGMPMKAGVFELLDYLKANAYRIAIASSSRYQTVEHHLEKAGIRQYFETITAGDMVEHSKPQPDIYLMACRSLGVQPSEAYAIEDSPNGIHSAFTAGMKVIMVPDMIPSNEEIRKKICKECSSLVEVISYLGEEQRGNYDTDSDL